MLVLQKHHITDLYVWVDDLLPKESVHSRGGRPRTLSLSEVVTILIWQSLALKAKTMKDAHLWIARYHGDDFPRLPKYQRFVELCHAAMPSLVFVLEHVLETTSPVRLMDSTMLPVCKLQRADDHKTCRNIADFGKNHQGWHYGFKLHASIDPHGNLCGLAFTPASFSDPQQMPKILNRRAKLAVGDTLYGAQVMRQWIFEHYGTIIVAPPHPKQRRKLMTIWQHVLLRARSKIESVFDELKEHLGLVTSFARSVRGYLLHYVRILLAYQIMALSS